MSDAAIRILAREFFPHFLPKYARLAVIACLKPRGFIFSEERIARILE